MLSNSPTPARGTRINIRTLQSPRSGEELEQFPWQGAAGEIKVVVSLAFVITTFASDIYPRVMEQYASLQAFVFKYWLGSSVK